MKVNLFQDLSPLKFCFVIKTADKNLLSESMKCLFSLWSGTYSNIIPYYEKFSKKFKKRYSINIDRISYYENLISNLDPDVIIYDDSIDEDSISRISFGRELMVLSKFKDGLENERPDFGLCLDVVINDIVETEFKFKREDNLKLVIPKIKQNDLLLTAWQGVVLDKLYASYFKKYLLKKKYVEEKELTYINFLSHFDNNTFPLRFINIYKTKINNNINGYRKIIYFLNPNSVLDVIDYWNLRALGWHVFAVPVGRMNKKPYLDEIIGFLKDKEKVKGKIRIVDVLISHDLKKKPILDFLIGLIKTQKVNVQVIDLGGFPKFWHKSEEVRTSELVLNPKVTFDYIQKSVETDDESYLEFELPSLPFKHDSMSRILFKVFISLNYWNNEGKYAEVISGISTNNWISIIRDFGASNDWRISSQGIIKYVSHNEQNTYFYLPKSFDFFRKFFSEKGFSINKTASGKLGHEVLKNIGGIYGINIFSTKNSIRIIQLFEGGKIVTNEELVGNIKRYNPFPEFTKHTELIDLLLKRQIIEFGIRIKCAICEQRSFYLPSELNEELVCAICRNKFELPKSDPKNSLKYVYRGVGPFSRNNKVDGLLSVFLTLRLFKINIADGIDRGISFIFDFEISRKEKEYEVDLVVLSKNRRNKNVPQLYICECKTFKHIEEKDCARLKYLGEQIPNTILVLATLNKTFTSNEKTLLKELVENFRTKDFFSTNPVLLLTGDELMPENRHFGLKKYTDKIAMHNYTNYMHDLADLTCEEHLQIKTCSDLRLEAWQKVHQT